MLGYTGTDCSRCSESASKYVALESRTCAGAKHAALEPVSA